VTISRSSSNIHFHWSLQQASKKLKHVVLKIWRGGGHWPPWIHPCVGGPFMLSQMVQRDHTCLLIAGSPWSSMLVHKRSTSILLHHTIFCSMNAAATAAACACCCCFCLLLVLTATWYCLLVIAAVFLCLLLLAACAGYYLLLLILLAAACACCCLLHAATCFC